MGTLNQSTTASKKLSRAGLRRGMKFLIHYTIGEGEEDTITVEGQTVEECQEAANKAVLSRGGVNPWSEQIEGVAKQG